MDRRPPPAAPRDFDPSSAELAVWGLVWVVVTLKVVETFMEKVPFGAGATIALVLTIGLPIMLLRHLLRGRRVDADGPPEAPYR